MQYTEMYKKQNISSKSFDFPFKISIFLNMSIYLNMSNKIARGLKALSLQEDIVSYFIWLKYWRCVMCGN